MPVLKGSDEDYGYSDLNLIMPDTWNNISWVVSNSIEILRDTLYTTRKMLESLKSYSIDSNIDLIRDGYDTS